MRAWKRALLATAIALGSVLAVFAIVTAVGIYFIVKSDNENHPETKPGTSVDIETKAQQIIARIPQKPTYPTATKILERLKAAGIGCEGQSPEDRDHKVRCSFPGKPGLQFSVAVFATTAERDYVLRWSLARGAPQMCVYGANWFIDTDAYDQAQPMANALGGTVVPIGL